MIGTVADIKTSLQLPNVADSLVTDADGAVERKLRRIVSDNVYDACAVYAGSGGTEPEYYASILYAQKKLMFFYIVDDINYFANDGKGIKLTETVGGGNMQRTIRYANPTEIAKIKQAAFDTAIQALADCGYSESYDFPIAKIEASDG